MASGRKRPEDCGGGAMSPEAKDERILLSRSAGGVQNVSLEPWSPTFEELVEATSAPQVGTRTEATSSAGHAARPQREMTSRFPRRT